MILPTLDITLLSQVGRVHSSHVSQVSSNWRGSLVWLYEAFENSDVMRNVSLCGYG